MNIESSLARTPIPGPSDESHLPRAWRVFRLAQFLELTPTEVHELSDSSIARCCLDG